MEESVDDAITNWYPLAEVAFDGHCAELIIPNQWPLEYEGPFFDAKDAVGRAEAVANYFPF
jgi:hypothetical protein